MLLVCKLHSRRCLMAASEDRHGPPSHADKNDIRHCEKPACESFTASYQSQVDAGRWVLCDQLCGAPEVPQTEEDLRDAYIHWRFHSMQSGCSHGH